MVKLWCSAADRIRARVQLRSEAGTPDMTIRRLAADRAGARPGARPDTLCVKPKDENDDEDENDLGRKQAGTR
jgi:hypothetical protein